MSRAIVRAKRRTGASALAAASSAVAVDASAAADAKAQSDADGSFSFDFSSAGAPVTTAFPSLPSELLSDLAPLPKAKADLSGQSPSEAEGAAAVAL
jgi:hypothetical protein